MRRLLRMFLLRRADARKFASSAICSAGDTGKQRLKSGRVACCFALATLLGSGPGLAAKAADLVVTITGLRSSRGLVRLCVFPSPEGFPNCEGKPDTVHKVIPASAGRESTTFQDLEPGVYAVSAWHDENATGRVPTNFLGVPKGGVGASNNPHNLVGPPRFTQAAFALRSPRSEVEIMMVYP
jgi:uncharacterized protein (DUF2141 family)